MNLTDAVDFEYPENEMAKPLKNITLSEADSTETFKFKPFEYERGVVTKTAKGVINTIRDMQDLPEQVKIFGKRLNYGFGAYFGDEPEEVNRKLQNLVTAERNLNEAQAERYKYTSGREAESLSYGVGGGIVNYGTMLIPAGAVGTGLKAAGMTAKAVKGAEAAGLTTMGVMELAGQVQDKTPMKDGEIDVEAMTPEWARKATGGTIAYAGISALTEKYVGFGQQVRMWSKPIQWGGNITSKALTTLKTAGKNALSEGMTEGIQDLEAAGIGLIDGTLTMDKLPARLQQAWKSAIIGSIIGGGVGTAAAMKSARNVKKQLREMVAPVVGEEDANTVAEAIYDAGTDDMTKAISIELELSSELKNKHGKVWNSMLAAVSREIEGKPSFMAMTEDERASYANTVAKHFADQVLAEANYRGTTLDAILSASDIVYDNGIKFKRHINLYDALKNPEMIPPETKLKRETLLAFLKRKGGVIDEGGDIKSRGAIKEYPGLINKNGMTLDDAALMAWEYGYFTGQERPTINDLLDAIDEGLRGHHRYNVEEERTFNDAIIDLATELDRIGIDYDNMTAAEIEKAVDDYEQEMRDLPEKLSLQTEAEFYANNEPEIGMSEDEAERFAIETEGKEYPVIDEKNLPERYYQFAGEKAQTAALDELDRAKQLEADGVDNEEIRQQTGWFKGADGKWRFEISDKDASINRKVLDDIGSIENLRAERKQLLSDIEVFKKEREKNNDAYPDGYLDELISQRYDKIEKIDYDIDHGYVSSAKTTLGELLNHDKLYDAYPSLRYISVILRKSEDLSSGAYSRKDNAIYLDSSLSDDEIKSILLHEIQHVIQEKENFARGGNVEFAKDYKKIIEKKASAEFMELLDKKMKEGLVNELKEYNLDKDAINNIIDANSDYTKILFDNNAENEEINKAEKKYYDTLEKYNISSDILEKAMNNLRDKGIWKEAENEIKSKNKLSDADAYDIYRAFFGEVEARNTQARMDLTEEERKAKTPESTQDIKNADALIVMPSGKAMAYMPEVIQKFYQRGKNAKGFTQITPDEYIIKLLEDADESTLPHELAHYWLTEMWNYTRTGRASENYMKRWQIISDYLGIKPEQTRLTRGQQEKFASSYEAYLTRGELPTPLIGSVFDDYDKWLQRVYSDYNKINYQSGFGKRRVRLTDAAIKFFQSMTTGTLEAPALAPKDTGVKLETEPQLPATTSNELIEEPAVSDTTIVTRGDKGVSKVYKRGALLHPEAVSQPGLSYDKMHLDEQALAAKQFVEKDLNKAREFIGGEKNETGKLSRTAVMLAYEQEMLRIGNLDEYDRVRKINAYESVRHGQEIAAQRIETDDVTNPAYWLEKAEHNLANQVAQKLFKGKERTKQLTETIKKETESLQKAITGKTVAEQQQIMRQTAERLKKEYGLDTLYQMPDDINDMTTQEFIKEVFGINLDGETRNDIINKSEQVRKLWENTIAKGGNPSVEAMKAKRELNDLINSKTPSNALAIWTSIFGRGIMLTSVKSPLLNIISNIEAGFTEGITRRLMYGTTEKAVDKSVKKEFSEYAWEVYKASGDIVTTMNDYDDDMRIIGEQILHSQGSGAFRAASRKVEEVSFKYLMGAPDVYAKRFAFNDTADLLATKIAREEGAKDVSKRATEIYKDAILIKPQTEQGQLVRKQAQEQAHYTTFTNDSWAARFGLSARNWLNMVGRNKIRLGDLTMKFVKTPANVQMMGLEYGFGSLYTLYNVQEIIKNPQSETSQIAIRAAVRNGLGIALAALLYSMLDPDDYFSEFDTLNPKEKDRMRAMGAMPNSIKIGNRWVSLDYFGQLGIPLVGMLEARRNNGLRSYIQSGLTQAAKIPGIKETKQLIDNMSEYARYDLKPEKIAQMMAGTVLDQARAMTIPAIVNDIAKMTDDYERDTMGGVMDKVISSIPGLRQTLPERYGIQGLVRTEAGQSPIVGRALTLLAGSRVKIAQDDKLVREVEKLAGKAEQPSISDVTKYGDLRLLSPEKKVKVRKEFYKAYNAESKKLISTREYQKKSPEDKKKALNKVRSRVVKSLKEKYNNDIQREKRRR